MTHPANVKRHMPAWVEGMTRAEGGSVTGPSGGDDLSKIRDGTLKPVSEGSTDDGYLHVRTNAPSPHPAVKDIGPGHPNYPDNFEDVP